MVRWTLARGLLTALLVLSTVPLSLGLSASFGEFSARAQGVIQEIRVEGSKRVEPETVRSYLTFSTGDAYDPAQIDESLKVLFATGLFQDVRIRREGATVIIIVLENPIVNRVAFEGNREIEDDTLSSEVQLKPRAVYTRARVQADVQRILDRELLRQFYLKNGYADARILSATADLDPNGRGFFITFTIEEGERYRFGTIDIESSLPSLNIDALRGDILTRTGRVYNVEKVEKTVEALTIAVSQQGYAFGQVRPRFERDQITHTMSIVFVIDEGPRIYIERINIVGNFRTHDDVIRRQFRLAEGDAYNRLLVEAARKRLRALGFFKTVEIDTQPGSAPDRVVIVVKVAEQPTGELSFGAGYSTSEGVIGDVSI